MKKHLVIILALLFAFSSCDSDLRRAKRYYQQAKEVAASDPASERRELSQRIKAKKIYTMPELEHSADYFAEKGGYLKASYGALYSGYVLHELRDDAAMICFKDAA